MILLKSLLFIGFIIGSLNAACSDYYTNLQCDVTSPDMIATEGETAYSCTFDDITSEGPLPTVEPCDIICPDTEQLLVHIPVYGIQFYATSARFDTQSWFVKQPSSSNEIEVDNPVEFGCVGELRCTPFIDADGVQYTTRCNVADPDAQCNEDRSKPLCTCGAGYTGPYCGISIADLDTLEKLLGDQLPGLLDLLAKSSISPAALLDVLPSIYAFLPLQQRIDMSWTIYEIIDSVDYEHAPLDVNSSFTQIFDANYGNCYTFNFANETDRSDGLYHSRFAGFDRYFEIMLKFNMSEQVAWIDSAAINMYIHEPGTPIYNGLMYSIGAGATDIVSLQKTITRLIANCITTVAELGNNQNYYESGGYTTDGCYRACYQDTVLKKCGCIDSRYNGPTTAKECTYLNQTCVEQVQATSGDPSSFVGCTCPQACYQENYVMHAARAVLPYKIASCSNLTHGCPDQNEDFSRLRIYMETLESQVYVEEAKMTLSTFLAQTGGQLGFLLGMSLVAVFELIILCGTLSKIGCGLEK